ncbi:helix-turn-helix transcriptional regulator [Streptomyces sp. HUAS TT20]|uniref:helix-turn-helix transcriptional regulator n=1 Tax=Streptomyces sp. HUAS TT20 TaxID=3447509 RepID=UPI0021D96D15|nr:LuxR C-terminal-related transcriptional regulator [Streptomyces sp. HUAS 15-9]UXY30521.1 LuxR C-terminal-related transcriptional regulator [Streptomyces sp. HUAS 15-9]
MTVTQQAPSAPGIRPASAGSGRVLVGRDAELLVLRGRLADPEAHLVTLTGPGGVGKSVLAAAFEAAPGQFRGVRTADLGPAASADEAAATVLRLAAELRRVPGEADALLVLDGCDHHGEPLTTVLGELLTPAGRLAALATSREPMRIAGERLLPVGRLPVPPPGSDDPDELAGNASVALFTRAARDAVPGFALTEENAAAVASLCTLLEGLPLALELAAGRLRLFTPQVLLARLRHRGGALTALSGGPSGAPARHRSLAALAESAVTGLSRGQLALLGQLAVFEPGFGLPMLERVSPLPRADTDAVLDSLLDRSLVLALDQEQGEPRFAVPEPVRSHMAEELSADGLLDAALDRHAAAYRQLVTTVEPRLTGPRQSHWLHLLAAEHRNVVAALHRLHHRGAAEDVASLVLALRTPWLVQGHLKEGVEWCDAVGQDEGPGRGPEPGSDGSAPRPALSEPLRARLVDLSATFTLALGDADLAVRRHRRALALCKRLGDRRQTALVSARMGLALLRFGDPAGALAALGPAVTALDSLGATAAAADATVALATALRAQGDTRKARDLLEKGLDAHRRVADARGLAMALREWAAAAGEREDTQGAARALRECLELYGSLGERTELPGVLEELTLLRLRTDPSAGPWATRTLAACAALRRALGSVPAPARRAAVDEALGTLRSRMHASGYAAAWAEGLRMTPATALEEALAAPDPDSRPTAPTPEAQPLTPRQVQVAMLVAEGLTNRQIASRLDISEWTVVNHVRQIMRRLGCTTRLQVAWSVGRWT